MSSIAYPNKRTAASQQRDRLDGLPHDILHSIVDHVDHRYAWLRSLLLVSRELYSLILPRLYRELDIWVYPSDCGPQFDYTTLQMLNKDNRGLEHVRTLILRDSGDWSEPREISNYPEAALLAHLLPKNVLKEFQWVSWHPMPSQIYKTLFSRQKSLSCIELNCSDIPIDEMIGHLSSPACLLGGLKDLEQLRIMPGDNEAMPKIACELLRQQSTIRHLKLDLVYMRPGSNNDDVDEEIDGRLTSKGGMRALFGNLKASSTHLWTLHLTGVNFSDCHRDLLSALDLSKLSSLTIVKCQHVEDFLAALAGTSDLNSMQLKCLVLYHSKKWQIADPVNPPAGEDEGEPDPLLTAIDRLLLNMPATLTDLWICLRGFNKLPSVDGLVHHSSTLRWLFVDSRKQKGPDGISTYSFTDWQRMCNSLCSIRQLDMAYPEVFADCRVLGHPQFCQYVKETASLNTLTTLGVNNWPQPYLYPNSPSGWMTRYSDLSQHVYKQTLSALAAEMLNLRREQPAEAKSTTSSGISEVVPKRDSFPTDLRVVKFGLPEEITRKTNWGYGRNKLLQN
ncbi:MAG: hypothetical protein Q9178_002854 [Gyalolechia marmorata]